MKISNDEYGGFVVSKNIVSGVPIRYSFREKGSIQQLNGWKLYSINDDEEYINNSSNFVILSAESIYKLSPVILEIFDAPYGTDLCWLYQEDVHIGFYDLVEDREITIDEILKRD
ncbi:DUF2185 domain-containing protein [Clostridium estertheticum]|uniref:DUF2185 domain-containing protein n=1 Tax=Clostridium estertheticum TaxID=238834 RepID=UPI001CF5ED91|nr:DUF2185 domain-containing protein [Clostridium estertheticum]MCB2357282.1 DUF2185 domain-containing protein [Clostridium estertheticum]WAG43348.1 DUF2185 domain-containing protein [Clostridium estertheticum]